jgi:hypothetical protein
VLKVIQVHRVQQALKETQDRKVFKATQALKVQMVTLVVQLFHIYLAF